MSTETKHGWPVDVMAVLDEAREMLRPSTRQTKDGRQLSDAIAEARATVAELIEVIRPRVASTFEEARAADDRGESLAWCQCDVLNPCWAPGMPITSPLRHWGHTSDIAGYDLACPDCQLRAALARVGGAS